MDSPHAIVIGAGLAGLAAAGRLRERGIRATVLERERQAGGRARSGAGGTPHAVDRGALGLAALARSAGVSDLLLPFRPAAQARVQGGAIAPLGPYDALGAPRLLDRLRLARLARVEARFRPLLAREASERAERLDDRSIEELARLYLPRAALGAWVGPLAAAWALGGPERASRVALHRLHAAGALAAALPRAPLDALADALGAGARLGCEALAVEAAGGALRVQLAGGAALEAEAVVLAVPAREAGALAPALLTPPERDVLAAARTAPAIALELRLERPLAADPTQIGVEAAAGLPFAALVFDPGGPGEIARARGIAHPAWSEAHLAAPDDAIEKELVAALERLRPGAARAIAGARVLRFPAAHPLFPVGRYRALARFLRVQADRRALGRRLYFAGDHLAGPTAEDAVRSGFRAADECSADLVGGATAPRAPRP
jgi:oxygen-dependent protoporphyrinogen oxidase